MRAITTATAAIVLSIDRKSLDNLLSRIGSGIITAGRQGVERRIPMAALEDIALTAELVARLGVPTREAFQLARQLLGRNATKPATDSASTAGDFIGSVALGPFIHLGIDIQALRTELQARLEQAIESHVRPRRGRPRKPRPAQQPLADA